MNIPASSRASENSEIQWRRFHKITPLASLGSFWILVIVIVFNIATNALEQGNLAELRGVGKSFPVVYVLLLLLALILVSLLLVGCMFAVWRAKTFALAPSGIHLRSGILFKSHLHTRWDRIQSVEIEQKLFGRILGFGSVKVLSGSGEKDINLGLLTLADCGQLRSEVLAKHRLISEGKLINTEEAEEVTSSSATLQPDIIIPVVDADDFAQDQLIYTLSTKQLVISTLLNLGNFLFALFLFAPIAVSMFFEARTAVAILLPSITGVYSFIKRLFDDFGTKIYASNDGLRRRSGLTTLKTTSYPFNRIHAVEIKRPLLWRRLDWWQMNITVAGITDYDKNSSFIFSGTRDEVMKILWHIMPNLGATNDGELVTEAFSGSKDGRYFRGVPSTARIFAPISYIGRGIAITNNLFVLRTGRFSRKISFILRDHVQSIAVEAGPLQRPRNLGTLCVHLVPGKVKTEAENFSGEYLESLILGNNLAEE